jgi:hypothetical protein
MDVGLSLDVGNTPCSLVNMAFLYPPKDYYTLSGLALSQTGPIFSGLVYWTGPRGLLGLEWPIHYPTITILNSYYISI